MHDHRTLRVLDCCSRDVDLTGELRQDPLPRGIVPKSVGEREPDEPSGEARSDQAAAAVAQLLGAPRDDRLELVGLLEVGCRGEALDEQSRDVQPHRVGRGGCERGVVDGVSHAASVRRATLRPLLHAPTRSTSAFDATPSTHRSTRAPRGRGAAGRPAGCRGQDHSRVRKHRCHG